MHVCMSRVSMCVPGEGEGRGAMAKVGGGAGVPEVYRIPSSSSQ
jgi:hypothetical protein